MDIITQVHRAHLTGVPLSPLLNFKKQAAMNPAAAEMNSANTLSELEADPFPVNPLGEDPTQANWHLDYSLMTP